MKNIFDSSSKKEEVHTKKTVLECTEIAGKIMQILTDETDTPAETMAVMGMVNGLLTMRLAEVVNEN